MLASRTVANALQALLVAAATDAGDRWYVGRAWPVSTLPAGKIVLADEDLDGQTDGDLTWPRDRMHTLQVQLQCMASDVDDPEAAADDLAEQALLAAEGTAQPLAGVTLIAQRITRQLQAEGQAVVALTTVHLHALFGGSSEDPSLIT